MRSQVCKYGTHVETTQRKVVCPYLQLLVVSKLKSNRYSNNALVLAVVADYWYVCEAPNRQFD